MTLRLRHPLLRSSALFAVVSGILALLAAGCADMYPRRTDEKSGQPKREKQEERTIRGVGSAPVPEEDEVAME
ncbi:MAG: hypothetical protein V5A84_05300, partial [Planctomycetota bacterium]